MEYRLAISTDLPFIYKSLRALAAEQEISERFSQTEASLREALFGEHAFAEALIAWHAGKPAGLCLFSRTNRNFDLFPSPGLYIHSIYILPKCRRKAYGTGLIEALQQIAASRGYSRIDWLVLKENTNGKDFWEKLSHSKKLQYFEYMRISLE